MSEDCTGQAAGGGSLPKGLIAVTALFAVLAAAAVAALVHMGQERSEVSATQELEREAISYTPEELKRKDSP